MKLQTNMVIFQVKGSRGIYVDVYRGWCFDGIPVFLVFCAGVTLGV